MKHNLRFALVVGLLTLAALACQTIMGTESPPLPEVAQPGFALVTDTPADQPMTPEMRNSGINFYTVTVTENSCSLSLSAAEQNRRIEFEGDQVRIWSNNSDSISTYDLYGQHRYLRVNDAGKPIVVTFSMEGYVLEVYNEGDNPNKTSPCGYFTFTLGE